MKKQAMHMVMPAYHSEALSRALCNSSVRKPQTRPALITFIITPVQKEKHHAEL